MKVNPEVSGSNKATAMGTNCTKSQWLAERLGCLLQTAPVPGLQSRNREADWTLQSRPSVNDFTAPPPTHPHPPTPPTHIPTTDSEMPHLLE